jgi:3-methyladenine DNA glycosylase AlkC
MDKMELPPVTPDGVLAEIQGKGLHSIRHIIFELSRQVAPEQALALARVLYLKPDVHGAMAAALLAGHVSYVVPEALRFLRETVTLHPHLKVQDCLARGLDHWLLNVGFERGMVELKDWGRDPREFARRAAVEAPRPWTRRDYFKARPQEAIRFVAGFKADPSPYVRFSVGSAFGEMGKDHPDLVRAELEGWNTKDPIISNTYTFAARHLHSKMGRVFTAPATPTA